MNFNFKTSEQITILDPLMNQNITLTLIYEEMKNKKNKKKRKEKEKYNTKESSAPQILWFVVADRLPRFLQSFLFIEP